MSEPTQRHPIFPSIVVSAPEDYPDPDEGSATRWTLTTPEQEPVGVLVFNDGGVEWTPALTENESAQAHGAELLQYLRGHRLMEAPLEDVLAGIQEAYTGDLTEDNVQFAVSDEAEELAALEDEALFSMLVDGSAVFAPSDDFSETVCIMAVPPEGWEGNNIGPEEKHATLLYFGKMSESADPDRIRDSKALFEDVLGIAAMETPPFTAKVTGIEALGDEDPPAQVWLLDSPELQALFGEIPEIDSEIHSMYEDAEATRYPEYKPHVTIGYGGPNVGTDEATENGWVSDDNLDEASTVTEIPFDRLSLWWGDEHIDFPLGSADFFLMDQPRAPEGDPGGGRWIKPGGGSAPTEDKPAESKPAKGPTDAEKKAAAAKRKAAAEAELDRLMDRLDGLLDKLNSDSSRGIVHEIGKERTAHRTEKDPIKAAERVKRIEERLQDLITAEKENLSQAELAALEKAATALGETEMKEQKDEQQG